MATLTTTPDAATRPRPLRRRYTSEERQRILRTVFLERSDGWVARFSTMMALAVTIAALGLLADSPAIVIGAMLIAPLMTPIQALSVAVAMGWIRRVGVPMLTVVLAVGGSVALAYVLSLLLPRPTDFVLPAEVLARTSPDVRDLLVALAAGAAGAYATAREDVSSALPGVAVAVALVPPLAVVGICLQAGRADLALGAMLLFLTNLVAILLAGITVLFVTGFVPLPHLRRVRRSVVVGVVPVVLATVFVAVPLVGALDRTVARANQLSEVNRRVSTWLGPDAALEVDRVRVKGRVVELDLVGTEPPPAVRDLAAQLSGLLGEEVTVHVRWSLRQSADVASGQAAAGGGRAPVPASVDRLRPVVDQWLVAADAGGRVTGLSQGDGVLVVSVSSAAEPPPAASLRALLAERLGAAPERVEVRWTQTRVYEATAGSPVEGAEARARVAAEAWAEGFPGLALDGVRLQDSTVTVTARGPEEPGRVAELEGTLRSQLGPGTRLVLRFTPERVLTAAGEQAGQRAVELDGAIRAAVDRWLAPVPASAVADLAVDGGVLRLSVVGADRPPPAVELAAGLAAIPGAPPVADVRWLARQEVDRAAWFPRDLLRVVPGADLFPYGSTTLLAGAPEVLGALGAELGALPGGRRIVLASHTDGPGPGELNIALSRERGEAVRAWLAANAGIAVERVSVLAFGEDRPVATNDTAEGRAANRRLEVFVERP